MKNKIAITCFGGVEEIGGNKILLEDKDFRVLFDFGRSFGRYGSYFDGVYLRERATRGVFDLITLGLIPPLRGVIRDDMIPALDKKNMQVIEESVGKKKEKYSLSKSEQDAFWEYWATTKAESFRDFRNFPKPFIDLILVSHAHLDHIGDIQYLLMDIPIASTRMTAFICKVLGDAGSNSHCIPYSSIYQLESNGLLKSQSGEDYVSRPWIFLDGEPQDTSLDDNDELSSPLSFWNMSPGVKKAISPIFQPIPKSINLKYWEVDHSLFGAIGSAIETSTGWVGYSGDIRFHGINGEKSWIFARELAKLKPVALICEGTRMSGPNKCTEVDVLKNCLMEIKKSEKQIVVADFAARNIERLLTFLEIAKQTDRQLILQPRDIFTLRAMQLAEPTLIPDLLQNPNVGLYDDPKSVPKKWEKLVREKYKEMLVDHHIISQNPEHYILAISLTDIADLNDLLFLMKEEIKGIYIFSNSPAYDEEQKMDLERLWRWTEKFHLEIIGLTKPMRNAEGILEINSVEGFHASGHAGTEELAKFVKIVNPKYLIPVHTEKPGNWVDLLKDTNIKILLPEYGKPLEIS